MNAFIGFIISEGLYIAINDFDNFGLRIKDNYWDLSKDYLYGMGLTKYLKNLTIKNYIISPALF